MCFVRSKLLLVILQVVANLACILLYLVGLDVESTYTPYYLGPRRMIATSSGTRNDGIVKESKYFDKKK